MLNFGDGGAVQTTGSGWQTTDDAEWQCQRLGATFYGVLLNFALETRMNSCAEFVLHSLTNIQPVQLSMQQMRQTHTVNNIHKHDSLLAV